VKFTCAVAAEAVRPGAAAAPPSSSLLRARAVEVPAVRRSQLRQQAAVASLRAAVPWAAAAVGP